LAFSNAKVPSLTKIKIKQKTQKTSKKLAPSNAKVQSLIKMKIKQKTRKTSEKMASSFLVESPVNSLADGKKVSKLLLTFCTFGIGNKRKLN
jgi:hypothetical protein